MKQTIFKSVMTVLMALFSLNVNAYDVEIEGIYYNLIKKANYAEVTYGEKEYGTYSGDIVIPSSIEHEGIVYPVTRIGDKAFYEGTSHKITSVKLPDCIKEIGASAFSYCSMTEIIIPDGVQRIGQSAFKGCERLTQIDIPNSVTEIDLSAFAFCRALQQVSLPDGLTEISSELFGWCSSLKSIDIPNTVTIIGSDAFLESGLIDINIPNSVTRISFGAFQGCGELKSITIGSGLNVINGNAFSNCQKMEDVFVYAKSAPSKATLGKISTVFEGSNIEYATLHVHGASLNSYKTTAPWSGFGAIVSLMPMHTLTYMVDGELYKSIEIEEGESIIPEAAPVKKNYAFSGWKGLPATMPTNDVTVTGTFTPNKYNLIYNVDGETYKSYQVEYGKSITAEAEPTKDKYSFSGWSEIPATMPAHDVTITGSFTRMPLVASYKRNLSSQTTGASSMIIGSYVRKSVGFNLVNLGEESINVTELVVKNASNYAVVSRSTDASLLGTLAAGNSIELSVNLTSDITTCYEWHYTYKGQEFIFCSDINDPAMKHDVTFYVDGQVYVTYEYDLGDEIIPEEEPMKEHYTFSGWSEIPATMPAHDVNVSGSFIVQDKNDVDLSVIEGTDMTEFLVNPDFATNDWTGWTKNTVVGGAVAVASECAEAWNKASFDIYQEVENLPDGLYEISVQGFYRYGRGDNAWNYYQAQEIPEVKKNGAPVFIYMNNMTASLKNVFEEPATKDFYSNNTYTSPNGQCFPDGMYSTAIAFGEGMFTQKVYGLLLNGETMRIGVKGSTNQLNDSWAIFDNFKLIYHAQNPEVVDIVLQIKSDELGDFINNNSESMTTSVLEYVTSAYNQSTNSNLANDEKYDVLVATNEALVHAKENVQIVMTYHRALDAYQSARMLLEQYDPSLEKGIWTYIDNMDNEIDTSDGLDNDELNDLTSRMESLTIVVLEKVNDLQRPPIEINDLYYAFDTETMTATVISGENEYTGNVVIPESVEYNDVVYTVTAIGREAFGECDITSITIPNSVTTIGEHAFMNCYDLEEVIVLPETPPFLYDNSFSNYSVSLKVPKGYKEAYQSAQGWSNFTNITDADKYKLTYRVDNEEYKCYEIEEGMNITPEAEPIKEGYTFSGWSLIPETMPAHDVTITGTFTFVDAIEGVLADDGEYQIYTLDGKPVETLQKGVNIIKYMSGMVKKMYVK